MSATGTCGVWGEGTVSNGRIVISADKPAFGALGNRRRPLSGYPFVKDDEPDTLGISARCRTPGSQTPPAASNAHTAPFAARARPPTGLRPLPFQFNAEYLLVCGNPQYAVG